MTPTKSDTLTKTEPTKTDPTKTDQRKPINENRANENRQRKRVPTKIATLGVHINRADSYM